MKNHKKKTMQESELLSDLSNKLVLTQNNLNRPKELIRIT